MKIGRLVIVVSLLVMLGGRAAATPAFPGAEGAGANASGGRGGDVYYVTTLADNGPGSLREAINSATGPRTILFNVSGNILLDSNLQINKSHLTIAGQTAHGGGITLQGYQVGVQNCHDVVVRFIRARPGDLSCPEFQGDAFHFYRATNCIADHISASWSIDEVLSCTLSDDITVQWCFITEALNSACHVKGEHGYGSLLRYGDGNVTYHHNLYADHKSRNPCLGDNLKIDFVNNVVYNWGSTAGYNIGVDTTNNLDGFTNVLNYNGNYLVAGPSTAGHLTIAFDSYVTNADYCQIHQSGNCIDSDRDGILDGVNTGWYMFGPPYTQAAIRYPLPQVALDTAAVAYQRVLALAGAARSRDTADLRVANDVILQAGAIIDSQDEVGGFPILSSAAAPGDGDNDGIADYWETALGWDSSVPNHNHVNPDGYTDLEWYLNWLAQAHAVCERDGMVEIDLRQCTGGMTNLTYSVIQGTNGVATLQPDGHTAWFTASAGITGLAGFAFNASDPVNATGFGPVSVSVLVAATNSSVTMPSINVTNPGEGDVLLGDQATVLSAGVIEGSGVVTNVVFFVGETEPLALLGGVDTLPYELSWTPPKVGGAYTIRAVARDANGLMAVDSIAITVNAVLETVSTALGNGADVEMQEQNNRGVNTSTLNSRTSSETNRNEIIGLRFDLAGYNPSQLTNVTLNLTSFRDDTSPRVAHFYGVSNGAVAAEGSYTTEDWSEAGMSTFGSLPGLEATDGDLLTQSIDMGKVTFLGEMTVLANSGEGTLRTFGGPALTRFVQGHEGSGKLTFLVAAGNTSQGQFRVASKEAAQTATGVLVGTTGDYAPFLAFTVLDPFDPPVLQYSVLGDGAGIEFFWEGPHKLQYQTNALNVGLGSDWMDYPETNPAVIVPLDPAVPSTFFRLSR